MRRRSFVGVLTVSVALVGATLTVSAESEKPKPLKITVYGGGGNIGQRIVREALDRGHSVTVISRDPSRVTLNHPDLKAAKGDVLDASGVQKTIAGQDVVVVSVSARRGVPAEEQASYYERAAQSVVSAQRALGKDAPRLIFVGGAGSLEVEPAVLLMTRLPPAAQTEVGGQKRALDYLRGITDVQWTYFSPAASIRPGERTGKFRLGGDSLVKDAQGESRISMEDYAVALIDEAENPQHTHKRFTIGY